MSFAAGNGGDFRLKREGARAEAPAMRAPRSRSAPRPVVYVVDRLASCGTTDLAGHLARRLDPARFRPAVWAVRAEGPGEPAPDAEAERVGAAAFAEAGIPAATLRLDARCPFRQRLAPLAARLRAEGAEVVHAHSRPADLWAVWAGVAARTPVRVYSRQATYGGLSPANRARYALTARLASRVVAVSEAVRTHLRRREGVPRERIELIHDAVDLDALDRVAPAASTRAALGEALGCAAEAPLVGCAAALTPRKGHPALLEAWPRVRLRHPQARLLLLGDGPERAALEARARELGVAKSVHFLGFRRDFADLLAALDVFVLPSQWEGLNLSLISACALGRAVVATNLVSNAEVVAHGVSGLLPSPARPVLEAGAPPDPQALAAAVVELIDGPARRRRLGEAARRRVRARFGADAMAARHADLYERLLAARGQHPPPVATRSRARWPAGRPGRHGASERPPTGPIPEAAQP